MEDGEFLSPKDKLQMEKLKKRLVVLKKQHKSFAAKKSTLSAEERDKWRENAKETQEINLEIKELRLKNIMEAGRG